MSITIDGMVVLREGKIRGEAIAQISTESLKTFLVLHPCGGKPELEVLALVCRELVSRGVLA